MRMALSVFFLTSALAFGLDLGSKAPDFSLTATDGKVYQLQKMLEGKEAIAVIFIATKCPYSNKYNSRYNELFDGAQKGGRAAILFVNSNDTEPMDEIKNHASQHGFHFPVLKDEKHKAADLFGAEKTPEAFLLDKQRNLLYHGRIDDDVEGKTIKRQDLWPPSMRRF